MVAMVCNRAICGVTPEFDEMEAKMSLEFNGKLLGFSFGNSEFKKNHKLESSERQLFLLL